MKKFSTLIVLIFVAILSTHLYTQSEANKPPRVSHIVLFDYSGKEAALVKHFKQKQSVYVTINPEARMRLYHDKIHGGVIGRYRIQIYCPSIAYFGQTQNSEL